MLTQMIKCASHEVDCADTTIERDVYRTGEDAWEYQKMWPGSRTRRSFAEEPDLPESRRMDTGLRSAEVRLCIESGPDWYKHIERGVEGIPGAVS